eukprot:CAMPEP_0184368968 /NCGR_PEP_ID=MMETSP1089-20130417/161970_1 /TAXON_ID=38269 ORGANISM="Gloeochaete wittrockiana, Strain SAG46.84" /NCGR_SAMPLE_ID=MMETSP1089 /ASSEMBLY_ACC=CAM_ASM_000445 /LENGTH=348 /DNA_ID=CAMNT_0026711351 /DNA_START=118 /DNA_END=1164 /DNA_ORIENTATION=-
MADVKDNENLADEDLVDYEDAEEENMADGSALKPAAIEGKDPKKGTTYTSIHSSGFRDFLLKPELLRAVVDCGFEHPSEVQHECIPQAILGMDVICQAKSGMGKTAVFVLATLQQLDIQPNTISVLVICHTRELAYQIMHEYQRFCKYMPDVKCMVLYGGVGIQKHRDELKNNCPHIVVGTPGRILQLAKEKTLKLNKIKHFILDECDKMLESLDMRKDVQEIFKLTPHDKQVMMFSATLSKDIRPVVKRFMQDFKLTPHDKQVMMFSATLSKDIRPVVKRFMQDVNWPSLDPLQLHHHIYYLHYPPLLRADPSHMIHTPSLNRLQALPNILHILSDLPSSNLESTRT